MNENESNDSGIGKDSIPRLTPTENALMKSMSTGKTNQQLAELHGISINTVKFHLHNIFDKLGVRNRKQAVTLYGESKDPSSLD